MQERPVPNSFDLLFRTSACGSMESRDLLADNGIVWSFININLGPVRILLRHIRISKDSFNRTFRNAGVTIDAGVSIDVKAIR